jgi:hypothetical protein
MFNSGVGKDVAYIKAGSSKFLKNVGIYQSTY